MNEFLTEIRLRELIIKLFPDCELIFDRVVPNSGILNRPDIRCEKFKIIIEFDGYKHYSEAKTQNADIFKDYVYKQMGYRIIRIPYFIQATKNVIVPIFQKLNLNIPENLDLILRDYQYPHGFIDNRAMLPINFNEYGIELFQSNLMEYIFACDEIITSIENKINTIGYNLCLPEKLQYLINNQKFRTDISKIKFCDPDYDMTPEERKQHEEMLRRIEQEIDQQIQKEIRNIKIKRILNDSK